MGKDNDNGGSKFLPEKINDGDKSKKKASNEKKAAFSQRVKEMISAAVSMGPAGKSSLEAIKQQIIAEGAELDISTDGIVASINATIEKLETAEAAQIQAQQDQFNKLSAEEQQAIVEENKKLFEERQQTELREKTYKDFDDVKVRLGKRQKEHRADLEEAIKLTKEGKEIPQELEKKLTHIDDDKQSKQNREDFEKAKKAYDEAIKHEKYATKEIKEIDARLKQKDLNSIQREISTLHKQELEASRKKANEIKKEALPYIEERNKLAKNLEEMKELKDNSPQLQRIYDAQAAKFIKDYGQSYQEIREQEKQEAIEQANNIKNKLEKDKTQHDYPLKPPPHKPTNSKKPPPRDNDRSR